MSEIRIVKMSGAGQDFILLGPVEARTIGDNLGLWVRTLCRRRLSVGADGVLVVEPLGSDRVRAVLYRSDGTEAPVGDGAHCAARFAFEDGMAGSRMVLECKGGEVSAVVQNERVRIALPPPRDGGALEVQGPAGVTLRGRRVTIHTPHFVVQLPSVQNTPLAALGAWVNGHSAFGEAGTDFDVMSWDGENDPDLNVRTWERGAREEALANTDSAVAAAFMARLSGAGETVHVRPVSRRLLTVTLPGSPEMPRRTVLETDARKIFEAQLTLEALG